MNGTDRLGAAGLGTLIVTALGGVAISAYLWTRAFTGGAEVVIRPPSIDAFRREIVPALIDLAEPRRAAAERAAELVRAGLNRSGGPTGDFGAAVPVASPPAAPGGEPREPGTPPLAPGAPPAGPTVPEPPATPPAPTPTPRAAAGTAGGPTSVQPTTPSAVAVPAKPGRTKQRAAQRSGKPPKSERAAATLRPGGTTPAQPATPPRPQEQKPTSHPAAKPATPATPPPHASANRKDAETVGAAPSAPAPAPAAETDHGQGNGGGKP